MLIEKLYISVYRGAYMMIYTPTMQTRPPMISYVSGRKPSTSQPHRIERAMNTPPYAAYTLPKLASGWKVGMIPYKNRIMAPAIK